MINNFFKKLASILLIFLPTPEMKDVLLDYLDFSKQPDFDLNISQILKPLKLKAYKIPVFISFFCLFVFMPFYFLYFRPIGYHMPLQFSYIFKILYLAFPIAITKFFGEKLQLIDNFHKKTIFTNIFTVFMSVFLNSFILFIASGVLYKILLEIPSRSSDFWSVFHIFTNIMFFITIFLIVKLFTCGTSYILPVFQAYTALFFLSNFAFISSTLSDISAINSLLIPIVVEYIVALIICFACYFVICKFRGEKYELSA